MKITRVFDILENLNQNLQKEDILASKQAGKWVKYSSKDYFQNSHYISYGLMELGLKQNDRIATISNNRPEWNMIDMGVSQAGMTLVHIDPNISIENYRYIINQSQPKMVIISDKKLYDKLHPILKDFNFIKEIFTFNIIEEAKNWADIIYLGKQNENKHKNNLSQIKKSISPDDLFTIIYTSGTTGNPKGVMISHDNIISNIKGIHEVYNLNDKMRTLSFLYLSHIFERTINYYFQSIGLSIYYAQNIGSLYKNLTEIKPNVLITIPRLVEFMYDKIIIKGNRLKGIKKLLYFWPINLGLRFDYNNNAFYKLKLKIANKVAFLKWRQSLGNNIKLIVTGGASLQPRLVKVFNAAGIPLIEGYGLTEASPVIATNRPLNNNKNKTGTVGEPLPGVKIKISDDGEILCQGPNIMLGYYNSPELTSEVIKNDGWLYTGDSGVFIEGKYLKITDRKKDIFKLKNGKSIAPQEIENKLRESFFIEQAMVIGENKEFGSALISPNFYFLHDWCSRNKISFKDNIELIKLTRVISNFKKEINIINSKLKQEEQIKKIKIVHEEWTPKTGELSSTLTLKRFVLNERYKKEIAELYTFNKQSKGIIPIIKKIKKN